MQSGYTRSDASLGWESSGKTVQWSATGWVKNIENKAQIQFGDFPLNRLVVNFPRTYGLSLSVKF